MKKQLTTTTAKFKFKCSGCGSSNHPLGSRIVKYLEGWCLWDCLPEVYKNQPNLLPDTRKKVFSNMKNIPSLTKFENIARDLVLLSEYKLKDRKL